MNIRVARRNVALLTRWCAISLAVLCAPFAVHAAEEGPPETCDPSEDPPIQCPIYSYPVWVRIDTDICEVKPGCARMGEPLHAELRCTRKSTAVHCEAFPQTFDEKTLPIDYLWEARYPVASGIGFATMWTSETTQVFPCGDPGNALYQVSVTVRSPHGLASSASVPISCNTNSYVPR